MIRSSWYSRPRSRKAHLHLEEKNIEVRRHTVQSSSEEEVSRPVLERISSSYVSSMILMDFEYKRSFANGSQCRNSPPQLLKSLTPHPTSSSLIPHSNKLTYGPAIGVHFLGSVGGKILSIVYSGSRGYSSKVTILLRLCYLQFLVKSVMS